MTTETVQEEQTIEQRQETTEDKHQALSHLDDVTRNEILSLRNEAKERRLKSKELQKQLDEMKAVQDKANEQKLIDEGKIKELLEERTKELDSLKPLVEKVQTYEQQFETQLEAVVSKLSSEQQDLIKESGLPLTKKLNLANSLIKQVDVKPNGPDSKRPGGEINVDDVNLDDYKGKEGRIKLSQIRQNNPKKFEAIMNMMGR
jgi:hypothetical protein